VVLSFSFVLFVPVCFLQTQFRSSIRQGATQSALVAAIHNVINHAGIFHAQFAGHAASWSSPEKSVDTID
jgi:hypothetical protein